MLNLSRALTILGGLSVAVHLLLVAASGGEGTRSGVLLLLVPLAAFLLSGAGFLLLKRLPAVAGGLLVLGTVPFLAINGARVLAWMEWVPYGLVVWLPYGLLFLAGVASLFRAIDLRFGRDRTTDRKG